MEGAIPIEEEVFTPNPLIVADIIFDSPKQQPVQPLKSHKTHNHREEAGQVMTYARHLSNSDAGGHPHVHFEDGKTTTMTTHQPSFSGPIPTPTSQPYAQQPQGAYPLPQNQQPYQQQSPYYPPPPPPNQQSSAPIPIPMRPRERSISHPPPQVGAYSVSPAAGYAAPPAVYGSWPQHNYYPPPPAPAPGQPDYFYGAPTASGPAGYLPGPGGLYPPAPNMRPREDSNSSYASRSSHRHDQSPDSLGSDEDSPHRKHHHHHHHRHHGSRHSSFTHGDRGDGKYSNHSDHASLADTLVLIWDGLSGGLGKPKRY